MVSATAESFADARTRMVNSQLRPARVTDPRVIAAMHELPRERFLPPNRVALAYADEDVPLGNGRVLIEPRVIARMVQLAEVVDGDRALVVGSGTGFGAALLAACGARVTALEDDPALQAVAEAAISAVAPGVSLVSGPLAAGWAAGAPYDVILIEGAVREIPPAIAAQLRIDGGRLVALIRGLGGPTQAVLAEATPAGLRAQAMFDCGTPAIPSLLPAPAFQF